MARNDETRTPRPAVGYLLVLLAVLTWVAALALAVFLPLPLPKKAALVGMLIGAGEVSFLAAGFFFGEGVLQTLRNRLRPARAEH